MMQIVIPLGGVRVMVILVCHLQSLTAILDFAYAVVFTLNTGLKTIVIIFYFLHQKI